MISGCQLLSVLDIYGKVELLKALSYQYEDFSDEERKVFKQTAERIYRKYLESFPRPSKEMLAGSKIEAIKAYRDTHLCSLRDAKEVVEYWESLYLV